MVQHCISTRTTKHTPFTLNGTFIHKLLTNITKLQNKNDIIFSKQTKSSPKTV